MGWHPKKSRNIPKMMVLFLKFIVFIAVGKLRKLRIKKGKNAYL